MAKQTIDILSMLEEKTAGNLNNEEKNLLKNILYDLRLMYVKREGIIAPRGYFRVQMTEDRGQRIQRSDGSTFVY